MEYPLFKPDEVKRESFPEEVKRESFIDLENSTGFILNPDMGELAGNKNYKGFCQLLFEEITLEQNRLYKKPEKIRTLELLIFNLIYASILNITIGISRRAKFYSGKKPTYRTVKFILSTLVKAGYVKQFNGFYNRKNKYNSRCSRIHMTEKLRYRLNQQSFCEIAFESIKNNQASKKNTLKAKPLIIIHDDKKNCLKLPENAMIPVMEENLKLYNNTMNKHMVTLKEYEVSSSDQVYRYSPWGKTFKYNLEDDYHYMNFSQLTKFNKITEMYDKSTDKSCIVVVDQEDIFWSLLTSDDASTEEIKDYSILLPGYSLFYSITGNDSTRTLIYCRYLNCRLHRVFNMDLVSGGRFYGAEYQTIKKGLRKHILIDGQETVELDYAALHPRMLYHDLGINYSEDPYLEVLERFNSTDKQFRKIVKLTVNSMINATSPELAYAGINKTLYDEQLHWIINNRCLSIKDIINVVEIIHSELKDSFYTGAGLELMNLDSCIADHVLQHFTKQDKPCLCIHDSFIVANEFEDELRKIMVSAYRNYFNYDPVIK